MRTFGSAPKKVEGPGVVVVAISATDPSKVVMQMSAPDWWMELSPLEARWLARLLEKKAQEVENDLAAAGGN